MRIKQILGNCLVKMGMEDFTGKAEMSAKETETLERLLKCANMIYAEISSVYLPKIHTETVELNSEGVLNYSTLSRRIISPVRLIKNGMMRRFVGGATILKSSFSGEAELDYVYMPDEMTLEDVVDDARLLNWVFEDGICGEYAFQEGMFDIAAAFDKKFRDSMARLKYKGREIRVRPARWGL